MDSSHTLTQHVAQITARQVMHVGCTCIGEDKSVAEAARMMAHHGIGAVPICNADDRLVGMITDRDIVVKCIAAGKNPAEHVVGEYANGHVLWVNDVAPVSDVIALMEEHMIRRVPVIDEHRRLVGIVSQGDLATRLEHEVAGELVCALSSDHSLAALVG